MATVRRDGVSLVYERRGTGPCLLFLHGFTATRALWSGQMDAFADTHTCIAMDLRGHGDSASGPQESYSIGSLAGDALAVLDDAGFESATVAGHSLGGMIAQHLAVHHADRMGAVILSSTTCRGPERERFEPLIKGAIALADMPEEDREADPLLRHSSPITAATGWGCGEAIMGLAPYDEQIGSFAKPALLVFGTDDSGNIRDGSALLAAALPGAKTVEIAGAGHVPQLSHAAAYNAALADFLAASAAS
jgi:pimeloyl-ACP methyl ester carboxylesterase